MELSWRNEDEREKDERMRKWKEIHSQHILILSLFPPSLSIFFIKIGHILSPNVNYSTFVANVTKNLTYELWGNNSGEKAPQVVPAWSYLSFSDRHDLSSWEKLKKYCQSNCFKVMIQVNQNLASKSWPNLGHKVSTKRKPQSLDQISALKFLI